MSDSALHRGSSERASSTQPGVVGGAVVVLLRLEGLLGLIASVVAYAIGRGQWLMFVTLFLVLDLAILGYLRNARLGATVYNLVHTYVSPAILLAIGLWFRIAVVYQIALVWIAHIGFDRALGFGLKYPVAFQATHLRWTGRPKNEPARRIGDAEQRAADRDGHFRAPSFPDA
jgi:hypothetical protein